MTDFREGGFVRAPPSHPHPLAGPKKPILNRVKEFSEKKLRKVLNKLINNKKQKTKTHKRKIVITSKVNNAIGKKQ